MRVISDNSQSQRPTVVEEESKREEEDDLGFTKEELKEAEEIREKEVDIQNEVVYLVPTPAWRYPIHPRCNIHLR